MNEVALGPGDVVGSKYRLVRLLGQGGMGAVFEAENTVTGKRVALKWMHADMAQNPQNQARFVREAQASARVRHPNVVDVYDVLNENESLFLVMEYLEGETLSELMARETTSLPELIGFVLDAMRGTAAAHKQGIIHRDIKPDNIFLARIAGAARPIPTVLDFGISKLSGTFDASLTSAGTAIGTPHYMSTEQLRGDKDIDARTDVYAFGVILYQAVTGAPPFDAETYPALIGKILTEPARPPKELRPDVPSSLSRLIERALHKDRQQRFPNLDAFIEELEPFATELGFRGQMTLRGASIPAVRTPSSRPVAAPPAPMAVASTVPSANVTAVMRRAEPLAPIPVPHAPAPLAGPPRRGVRGPAVAGAAAALLLLVLGLVAWLSSGKRSAEPGVLPSTAPSLAAAAPLPASSSLTAKPVVALRGAGAAPHALGPSQDGQAIAAAGAHLETVSAAKPEHPPASPVLAVTLRVAKEARVKGTLPANVACAVGQAKDSDSVIQALIGLNFDWGEDVQVADARCPGVLSVAGRPECSASVLDVRQAGVKSSLFQGANARMSFFTGQGLFEIYMLVDAEEAAVIEAMSKRWGAATGHYWEIGDVTVTATPTKSGKVAIRAYHRTIDAQYRPAYRVVCPK